ncbi:MAG: YidC/Oxa1 family membrane protein insertase [Ruminococcaceae bacterium]|nr:YidC/Oxa1 family membrane protein insertase [Oscillospiraceae bacterium]
MMNALAFLAPVLGPVLKFIYQLVNNYGLAIILFSILMKLLIFPLNIKQQKSMEQMRLIQPELAQLNKKYKNDKEKLQKETMKLYEKYNVNPTAGCLPMLIQFPIIFALYRVINQPMTYIMGLGTETIIKIVEALKLDIDVANKNVLMTKEIEIANQITPEVVNKLGDILPEGIMTIDFNFLGLDLASRPQLAEFSVLWIIPVLAMVTTYLTSKITTWTQPNTGSADDNAASMSKSMMTIMPLMTGYFCFLMPSGVGLYWIINNVLSILQQVWFNKKLIKEKISSKKKDGEVI